MRYCISCRSRSRQSRIQLRHQCTHELFVFIHLTEESQPSRNGNMTDLPRCQPVVPLLHIAVLLIRLAPHWIFCNVIAVLPQQRAVARH